MAATLLVAATTPERLPGVLAAAASSLFEAAPFAVGISLLGRFRGIRHLSAAACGCGSRLPPALAVAPIVLTYLAFGLNVTVARTAVAVAAALVISRLPSKREASPLPDDPLAALTSLAAASLLAALAADTLHAHAGASSALATAAIIPLALAVGLLAPCATSGLAVAATLRADCLPATIAVLATSGFLRLRLPLKNAPERDARFLWVALACAFAVLGLRGTAGFLNPRLAFVAPLGAAVALVAARRHRTTRSRLPALPALLAFAALASAGAPVANSAATSLPLQLYAGERVDFIGYVSARAAYPTTLSRSVITCCRADARTIGIELERRLPMPAGSWVNVRGVAHRQGERILVRADDAHAVAPPSDPFLYL